MILLKFKSDRQLPEKNITEYLNDFFNSPEIRQVLLSTVGLAYYQDAQVDWEQV